MVFLRPTIVRDAAGMAALSGKKYSDLHFISNTNRPTDRPGILPANPSQLFERNQDPAVDLRR